MRCTTPPFDDDDPRHAAGAALPLHFSANAQDAVGPPARFVLYGVPTIRAAAPLSGPILGGTLVVLDGAALGNGSDYRCRFGDGAPVDEAPGADVVLASFDGDRHAISCVSPPARDGAPGGRSCTSRSTRRTTCAPAACSSTTPRRSGPSPSR